MPNSFHPGLDPAVADRLLELLGNDDAFRALFQKDPAAALASLGHGPAVEAAQAAQAADTAGADRLSVSDGDGGGEASVDYACMATREIASKEEILAAREALQRYLIAGGNHNNPHAFEAGMVQDFLSRK